MARHELVLALAGMLAAASGAAALPPPLIDEPAARAIADSASGSTAKRTVEGLSRFHRMRGSRPYNAAVDQIVTALRAAGLAEVGVIALPADGSQMYGTQRARPAWNADLAELWEQRLEQGRWRDAARIVSFADQPLGLAQDSAGGIAETSLVDVGAGTAAADYAGKDVRGKLVLASAQPGEVAALALTKLGAAGIVSWAQNQKTAWWGEDQELLRWGHMNTWKDAGMAFMVTPAQAHAWQARLARGETVRLRGKVVAGRSPGEYRIPTAIIPGRDRAHEIVYSCHLDHPNPGANDNASGCAGVLEVARTLQALVAAGRLPQPARTIRFLWPCEIECTISLLNARPEFATRTLATIHLDMIGGGYATNGSSLHVEGAPPSLDSFVDDVGFAIARWLNDETRAFVDGAGSPWAMIDPAGDRHALQAEVGGFSEGSDHEVWTEGSWRVPVVYVSDWPDRYIHTTKDVPANLDPTKMKRAIFIAAATGWVLANLDQRQVPAVERALAENALEERATMLRRLARAGPDSARLARAQRDNADAATSASLARFGLTPSAAPRAQRPLAPPAKGALATVYNRIGPKGPMSGFGYNWLEEQLAKAGIATPALAEREAAHRAAGDAYEALNLVDGRRSVAEIHAFLAATGSTAPVGEVADYLAVLHRVGLIAPR